MQVPSLALRNRDPVTVMTVVAVVTNQPVQGCRKRGFDLHFAADRRGV
jgi:hypothetical protein